MVDINLAPFLISTLSPTILEITEVSATDTQVNYHLSVEQWFHSLGRTTKQRHSPISEWIISQSERRLAASIVVDVQRNRTVCLGMRTAMLIVHTIVTERGLHPSASAIWDVVSDLPRTISRMYSRLAGSRFGAILRCACSPAGQG